MSYGEGINPHQVLADNLTEALSIRVREATTIATLNTHRDRVLRVVQEAGGKTFVTRSFSPEGVVSVEMRSVDFRTAWKGMYEAFNVVGIDVVKGALLETGEDEYPFIAIHEHLEDVQPLIEAPTEVKKELAGSMGRILLSDSRFLPSPEMMREDMFGVTANTAGQPKAVLLDTDPYMISRSRIQSSAANAWYLERVTDLLWDHWCRPEEREEVFKNFVLESADLVQDADPLGEVTQAFTVAHLMSNGVDTRHMMSSR